MVFAIHWPRGIGWREISLNVPCPKPQNTCIPNDHIYHNSKHIIVMSKTRYQISSSDLPRHHSIFGRVTIWGFLLKPHFLWSSLLVCAVPVFKILLEALTHSSVDEAMNNNSYHGHIQNSFVIVFGYLQKTLRGAVWKCRWGSADSNVSEHVVLNLPLLLLTGDYGSSRDPSGRSYTTHASESAGEFELLLVTHCYHHGTC